MTLVEFLMARIAEDEAAIGRHGRAIDLALDTSGRLRLRRLLAECEAKRRIVELHHPFEQNRGGAVLDLMGEICTVCRSGHRPGQLYDTWPCPTLRALALPYADHPDYDEGWRP